MATKHDIRQYPLTALVAVGPEHMGDGNGIDVPLPGGAHVVDVKALGTVAFDSGTTATMTVAAGATTFVNAQSIATAGVKTVALAQAFFPTPTTVKVTAAQTGDDATAGEALVAITYVVKDRWSENQD